MTIPVLRQQIAWFWGKARGCRVQAVLNIGIGLILVGADFAFIFLSKLMIDTATGADTRYAMHTLAVAIVALIVIGIAVRVSRRWMSAILGVRAQNQMQEIVFRQVLQTVWQGRERRHTGDIVNRLETDVNTIIAMATDRLPQLFVLFVRLVGSFIFLALLDTRLAVAVVVMLPFFILLSRVYFRRMRAITREVRKTDSLVQSTMQELVQHSLVVKTLQQVEGAVQRLAAAHRQLQRHVARRTRFGTFSFAVLNIGFSGVYIFAFLWGAYSLHDGHITYGTLIAFVQLVTQIQLPFRELTHFVPAFINTSTSIERLMELERLPCEEEADEADLRGFKEDEPLGVRFENVTYQYTARQTKILDGVSFDFRPSTCNAILGPTGVGKTTMIRLILSLIKPDTGRVTLYGEGHETTASVATRTEIVYVPQGNTLLSGSIRDNLLFGCPHATDTQIRSALHTACADFVYELHEGLDTMCGEMGMGFSEGQAQRISIARSLLHGGRIILLDEATSALDIDTEQRLLDNLKALADTGRTIIFITHRQEVLQICSEVIRLTRHRA